MFGKKTKEDMPRNSSQLDEWTDDLFKAFLKYRFYRFEESGFIRYMYKLDTMRKNLLVYEHANGLCGEREPEFYGTLIFGHNEPTVIKAQVSIPNELSGEYFYAMPSNAIGWAKLDSGRIYDESAIVAPFVHITLYGSNSARTNFENLFLQANASKCGYLHIALKTCIEQIKSRGTKEAIAYTWDNPLPIIEMKVIQIIT